MTHVAPSNRIMDHDPFFDGYCPVKHWKKVKKKYRQHNFEVLEPQQLGRFMHFKYISTKQYMRFLSEFFSSDISRYQGRVAV